MKNAIVTGFSSGIGFAICEALEKENYNIIKLKSRLQDTKDLELEIKTILKTCDIDILVNCAGVGIFRPHEELNISKIKQLIDINLTAPIILTNLVLRSLKKTKGHIINITSIEATKHSKFSALYTATKSGLRDFSLCLFEEGRKDGVKITSINPDITKTNFFDDLPFGVSKDKESYLLPQTIAKAVLQVIATDGAITDLTIRPQKFALTKS
jgi:short-subunit dehydrogenase